MAVINKEIQYMALPLAIHRGNPFPSDDSEVWYDKSAMETYAQTSPVAYVGQFLVYVNEEGGTVEAYVIQNTAGALTKLASTTASGDLTEDVLELQGKVAALEAAIGSKGEESEVVATNLWDAVEEIKVAYETADTSLTQNLTENYYKKTETDSKIDEKIATAISSTYKPAGSVEFASLPALAATEEGKVYNLLDAFTTTEDFVEGAGNKYPIGTNVVCVDVGDESYKWDVLAGFVDLSAYEQTASVTEKLNNKVDKVPGSSLVEDTLIEKLRNLDASLETKVDKVGGSSLVEDTLIEKLRSLADIKSTSAEFTVTPEGQLSIQAIDQNKITGLPDALAEKLSGIKLGNVLLKDADGVVTIPIATADQIGVVKGTNAENGVTVAHDGTMSVNSVNISKLVQDEGDILVLDGGMATPTAV